MATFALSDKSEGSVLGLNRKFSLGTKGSSMKIELDNHFRSKVYTSCSKLSGVLTINTSRDVRFDSLQILFMGISKTRVDGVSAPHTTSHTFLRQEMPIPDVTYPVPRVYEAGRTYTVPFNFVIPAHLTINACNHDIKDDAVRDHHLALPPTMGSSSWERDDFSPEMARVDYYIKARVLRDEAGRRRAKIMETSEQVKVLPAYQEFAPLNVTQDDRLYTTSKSKSLRKSILSSKSGKVTVLATQPRAVMISPDGQSVSNTQVQLDLKFEPATSQAQLPKVTSVSSKVTAFSYFCSGGISTFPNLSDWNRSYGSDGRGSYSTSTSLLSAAPDSISWQQHLTGQRRDSAYDSADISESDTSRSSSDRSRKKGAKSSLSKDKLVPYYHTASLTIPLSLPSNKKTFIPTFHSCITSRVYVISVTVSLSSGGGGSSSVTLAVPLQIGVASMEDTVDDSGLPTFEAALSEAEADAYLVPRTLRCPDVQFERQALPGYGDIARGRQVAVRN